MKFLYVLPNTTSNLKDNFRALEIPWTAVATSAKRDEVNKASYMKDPGKYFSRKPEVS